MKTGSYCVFGVRVLDAKVFGGLGRFRVMGMEWGNGSVALPRRSI